MGATIGSSRSGMFKKTQKFLSMYPSRGALEIRMNCKERSVTALIMGETRHMSSSSKSRPNL
jgi:hypothetical protein